MPKVTIYMPDALAERVKALGLSMSPICQSALQQEVDKVTAVQNATRNLDKVARRLRKTIEEHEVASRRQGFSDGTKWARDTATMSEFRRVAGTHREYGRLQAALEPCLGEYIQQLWQQRLQEEKAWDGWEVDSEAYIEGFADAAALVYREVLPLL